jgi:TetR/AcrR family transcriptional regulator, tetracycline repressor protein
MPRRSARPRLNREAIVAKALEIADAEGIDHVSFRRLAADFGVTPMALYTHVRDKSDLLDAMADSVLGEIQVPTAMDLDWTEKLRLGLQTVYAVFDRHPSSGAVLGRPVLSPASMRVLEILLTALGEAGFSAEESIRLIQAVTSMILGGVVLSSAYARLNIAPDEYAEFAGKLATRDHPMLASVLPVFVDWRGAPDQRDLTIELVVGGLKAIAEQRRA